MRFLGEFRARKCGSEDSLWVELPESTWSCKYPRDFSTASSVSRFAGSFVLARNDRPKFRSSGYTLTEKRTSIAQLTISDRIAPHAG